MKNTLLAALALALVSTLGIALHAQVSPDVTTYIKTYANFLSIGQVDVTPGDVERTSDGGYILLGLSYANNGVSVSWLIKIDPLGNAQWTKELGVFHPAVSYALGVSVQQTRDGGYIVAGSTVGGGLQGPCSSQIDIQCVLVEKLTSFGSLQWSFVYDAAPGGSYLNQIRQTPDGGYIAVGGTGRDEGIYGGLILKLNSFGGVVWQRAFGPNGSTLAALTQVVLTADGGFTTLGYTYVPQSGAGIEAVLLAKYSGSGILQWQYTYNEPNGHQAPYALAQSSDGGYVVGGTTGTTSGDEVSGMLLKFGPRGNLQWQKSYSSALGGDVIYSVHQTTDGGYVLAGDSASPACQGLVPWMTKVDSAGNLLWQHLYYATKPNGCPASEYFASSTLTDDGGILSLGWTEDSQSLLGLLYGVKTDSNGLCSSGCSEIYPVPQPSASSITLTPTLPILPTSTTITPGAPAPSQTQATSAVVMQDCD